MKKLMTALFACAAMSLSAEITDATTGATFPSEVSFTYEGKTYELQATGVSTRKKFIVKVYSVASYLQKDAPAASDKIGRIMNDEAAKQLTLKWLRDVEAAKVQEGFRESLNGAFVKADLPSVQANIDQFVGFFGQNVTEGEEQVIRWIPGGTIEVEINGTTAGTIQNTAFAKGLWAIWFGDKSVVDRNNLLSEMK